MYVACGCLECSSLCYLLVCISLRLSTKLAQRLNVRYWLLPLFAWICVELLPRLFRTESRVKSECVQISENHGSKCTSSVSSTIVNINKLPLVLLFTIIWTHSICHSDVSELLTNNVIHDLFMTHICRMLVRNLHCAYALAWGVHTIIANHGVLGVGWVTRRG